MRRTECNAAFSPSGLAEFSKTLIWFVFLLGACGPDGHRQKECNSKVLGQDAMCFLFVPSNTDLRIGQSKEDDIDMFWCGAPDSMVKEIRQLPLPYPFNVKIKLQISAQQQGPESSLHFKTWHPERLSAVIHAYTDSRMNFIDFTHILLFTIGSVGSLRVEHLRTHAGDFHYMYRSAIESYLSADIVNDLYCDIFKFEF